MEHMKCGAMRSRPDGVSYFEVNTFAAIVENVIPFFDRFGFLSAKKQRDFAKFKQIARLIRAGAISIRKASPKSSRFVVT